MTCLRRRISRSVLPYADAITVGFGLNSKTLPRWPPANFLSFSPGSMHGRRFLFVDTTLARPGIRCRLADFSVAAIAARFSQHCLDGFKIKKELNPERGASWHCHQPTSRSPSPPLEERAGERRPHTRPGP